MSERTKPISPLLKPSWFRNSTKTEPKKVSWTKTDRAAFEVFAQRRPCSFSTVVGSLVMVVAFYRSAQCLRN